MFAAKCLGDNHVPVAIGEDYGFTSSVAVHPFTEENPAAHGGIRYCEECEVCGARRRTNANGRHREFSPWGPTAHERATMVAAERKAAYNRKRGLGQAQIAAAGGVEVLEANASGVSLRIGTGQASMYRADLAEAAAQADESLSAFYGEIANMVSDFDQASRL